MGERATVSIVFNSCYGGFSLSDAGVRRYAEIKGIKLYPENDRLSRLPTYWTAPPNQRRGLIPDEEWYSSTLEERQASNEAYGRLTLSCRDFERTDPALVQVVRELGAAANGMCADLKIAEVMAGERYRIDEYDGNERVMKVDDYEWLIATPTGEASDV